MKARLHLFLYSLILPLLWLTIGFALRSIAPDIQLGVPGLVVVLLATYWLIAFLFASNFGRQLTLTEEIQLILSCSFWAIIIEALAIFAMFPEGDFDREIFINTLLIAAVVQLIYNSLATHFACKKFINKRLERVADDGT